MMAIEKTHLPKWLLSALWYMASCRALFWALVKTGSSDGGAMADLSPPRCCGCAVPELPSASISSRDRTSFSPPRLDEKFNGCDNNWCRQPL